MLAIRPDWDVTCCQFFHAPERFHLKITPSTFHRLLRCHGNLPSPHLCARHMTRGCTLSLRLLGLKLNSRVRVWPEPLIHWNTLVKSVVQAHSCCFVNKAPRVLTSRGFIVFVLFSLQRRSLIPYVIIPNPPIDGIGMLGNFISENERERQRKVEVYVWRKREAFEEPHLKVIEWASHTETLGTSKRSPARGTLRKAHRDAFEPSTLWETERMTLVTDNNFQFLYWC